MPDVKWFKSFKLVGCLLTVRIDAFSTTADIETEIQYSNQLFGDKLTYYWNQGLLGEIMLAELT